MDPAPILSDPWPQDLNPADVPFLGRTRTVLQRQGYFDDPAMLNTLTAADVADWWYAGPVTIDDLRTTGNKAIQAHHVGTELRQQLTGALCVLRDRLRVV
jgi:hypothetical protein